MRAFVGSTRAQGGERFCYDELHPGMKARDLSATEFSAAPVNETAANAASKAANETAPHARSAESARPSAPRAASADLSANSAAKNPATKKEIFLRALAGERPERVPVWMMRQAGRYLPGYRKLREKYSFLELAKTPELAAQISIEPYERLDVDAIIVFSDILIVAEAMGQQLEINDDGPKLGNPVRARADLDALREFDAERETRFVGDAIRAIERSAGNDVPVLGFAAAPWTLACYMVEGRTRGEIANLKRMMYDEPALVQALLAKIARVTSRYLHMQIAAGATAVQLFDTWAGELSAVEYERFALPATAQIISEVRRSAPVILFAKNSAHFLRLLARSGANALNLDWRVDLAAARRELGQGIALQGNVDPARLLASEESIRAAVREAIAKTGGAGHILNLGHGVLPATPVESAKAFVRAAREFSQIENTSRG